MTKAERLELLKTKFKEMRKYEEHLMKNGIYLIAGVDEVGRGPLAGPVVAAAVVLPRDFDVLGIDDSKKLSEKKRDELYSLIVEKAIAIGIGIKDNYRIDEINILEATKEAMEEAVMEVMKKLSLEGEVLQHILIDALTLPKVDVEQTGIIKGDGSSISIAAASIIAKVTRDNMMKEYAKEYPAYLFEKNKGYGTKQHYDGIKTCGICPIHRKTFLKNIF